MHFVGRHPQMTVGELLGILRITKQSLNRVLGQLVRQGSSSSSAAPHDRRQRLLELTESGRELERRLSEPQRARVAAAYREAGAQAVEGFRKVMLGIIADEERPPPLRPAAPADGADASASDRILRGDERSIEPHLLVVDDDARLRELLRRYLSDNGFRVTLAADAAEARANLASFAFDLIVLDVMMPGESGLDADPRVARRDQRSACRSCC